MIRLVVLMYVRFPLSLRNVEDLLFERGIDIGHETVRQWWNRFGSLSANAPTLLIAGASRGRGLAAEFLTRGWHVIGTVRGSGRTGLHDLAEANAGCAAVEALDIDDSGSVTVLRGRLSGVSVR